MRNNRLNWRTWKALVELLGSADEAAEWLSTDRNEHREHGKRLRRAVEEMQLSLTEGDQ